MSIVDVATAIRLLNEGDVVAIPTETVYGLAARINREDSLRRIFTVKQRPFFDPLIVHVASVDQARALTTAWPKIYDDLANKFWPGPLTLIAPKSAPVSSLITSGLETVALRAPDHPLALEILRACGPLAAPSANRFGRTSPTRARDVEDEFEGKVAVVDGGECRVGVESTVVQAEQTTRGTWRLNLLRPGGVARQQLISALYGKYEVELQRHVSVASPGHLKEHYQPANPVVIVTGKVDETLLQAKLRSTLHQKIKNIYWLHLPESPEQAARVLYSEFRRLSKEPGVIAVHRTDVHNQVEWEAIWDRLERAATFTVNL